MDINQIPSLINIGEITAIIFKITAILLSVFYLFYALVLARQVRVMGRTLESGFNAVIYLISSIQVAAAFILLIFAVFLV